MAGLVRSLVATAQSVVPTSFTQQFTPTHASQQPTVPSRHNKPTLVTQSSVSSIHNSTNTTQSSTNTPTHATSPTQPEPQCWWSCTHTKSVVTTQAIPTNSAFTLKLFIMRCKNLPRNSSNQPQSSKVYCTISTYSFIGGWSQLKSVHSEELKPTVNPQYRTTHIIENVPTDNMNKLKCEISIMCDNNGFGSFILSSDVLQRLYNDNTAVHSKYYPVTNTVTGHTAELHLIITSGIDTELTDLSENCLDPSIMLNSTQQQCMQNDRDKQRSDAIKYDNILTAEERAKREQQHSKVISEIQSSELSYTQSLNVLYSSFVEPLQSQSQKLNLDHSIQNALCMNIRALRDFHSHFSTVLNQSQNIVPVFTQFCDFFKLYIQYLNSYEHCIQALNNLRSNKNFQSFLNNTVTKQLHEQSQTQLDLLSYLIMPVQRIPRYVLLLRALIKQTDPTNSSEWNMLYDVLNKIESIAVQINETKRQIENLNILHQLQCQIDTRDLLLLVPHRHLVKKEEGIQVQEMTSNTVFNTIKYKKRILYLFTDILLYVSTEMQYKNYIDLVTCKCEILPESQNLCLELISNKLHIALKFDTANQCLQWYNDVNEQIRMLQEQRAVQRKRKQDVRGNKQTEHENTHSLIMHKLEHLAVSKQNGTLKANDFVQNTEAVPVVPARPKKGAVGTFSKEQAEFLTALAQNKSEPPVKNATLNPHQINGNTYKLRQVPRRSVPGDTTNNDGTVG